MLVVALRKLSESPRICVRRHVSGSDGDDRVIRRDIVRVPDGEITGAVEGSADVG